MRKLLIIPALLIVCAGFSQSITEPYDFPVKPGTDEWKNLKSTDEKIQACMIPEITLKRLTTKALAQTCLKYPLFVDVFSFNNVQEGIAKLNKRFNGFSELLNRKDAGTALFELYSSMKATKIDTSWTLLQKGKFTISFTYCELLIAQNDIINKLSIEEKRRLIKDAAKKFEGKDSNFELFGDFGLNTTCVIIARAIHSVDQNNSGLRVINKSDLSAFLSTGLFKNRDILYTIYNAAKTF